MDRDDRMPHVGRTVVREQRCKEDFMKNTGNKAINPQNCLIILIVSEPTKFES